MNKHISIEESMHPGDNGRRNFLKICSVVLTSLIGIAYAIPMIRAFISPAMQDTVAGSSGLFDIGNINDCEINIPRKVSINGSKMDAWNKFPPTAIGAVWILMDKDKKFTVFSSICPHLGCGVDWDKNSGRFICPCHDSYFDIEGNVLSGPSPRKLDTLETEIKQGKLFVKYQKMKLGISGKIPA
ncbi:MAG: ubiquinol-cytochrome c reductase iron-sulfur subunit [Candidatus Scalindua sp.]